MNFTKTLCLIAALGCNILCAADDSEATRLNVAFDMRGEYTFTDDEQDTQTSGFHGRYLNVMVNGTINSKFSYNWRQRMNKFQEAGNDIFAATDWVYLTYHADKNFEISAGKQVVLIGGYEYDAAPIDIFFASRFWNNIACYQFGASGSYITNDGKHSLTFQICNSPYAPMGGRCYAYNLFWNGNMGCFQTLWSVNMIEYERNHYANFIALGNRFTLGDFDLQVDLMNRATSHQKYLFSDYSIITKAEYNVTPWMTVMGKWGYDRFRELPGSPIHVDNPFYGGGLEFYPNKGLRDIRIHAIYDMYHDNKGMKVTELNIGIKWRVNLYSRN